MVTASLDMFYSPVKLSIIIQTLLAYRVVSSGTTVSNIISVTLQYTDVRGLRTLQFAK